MGLLAGDITHGQAVALVLLCIFLIVFIVVDVYLVLFLRRGNKKLAKSVEKTIDGESGDGQVILQTKDMSTRRR